MLRNTEEQEAPSTRLMRMIRGRGLEAVALAAYASLLIIAIPYHEPWADEAQAWQLAHTLSVSDLFLHHLRYEGTPGLWYLLLAGFSRLHGTYTGMRWLSGVIALSGMALLIYRAPLPRALRLALPFTFFLAFQYAVVGRSYVLIPLLLFATAILWRRSAFGVALLLGLLGHVAMHALVISVGLSLVYLVELLSERSQGQTFRGSRRTLLIASAALMFFYAVAVWTVAPRPPDLSFRVGFPVIESAVVKTGVWAYRGLHTIFMGIAMPVVLAIPLWGLLVWRLRSQLVYLLPVVLFTILSGYYSSIWHTGLVVPLLITIFWIAPANRTQANSSIALKVVLAACVSLQIAWTIHCVWRDHFDAYSPDLAAVPLLAPHVAAGEKLAVTYLTNDNLNAYQSIGLAPYFAQPIFLNQPHPFWWWRTSEHTDAQFRQALEQHPAVVLATYGGGRPFDATSDLVGPRVELLRQFHYSNSSAPICGRKPFAFSDGEYICYILFERSKNP